jgi:hypothetical protein
MPTADELSLEQQAAALQAKAEAEEAADQTTIPLTTQGPAIESFVASPVLIQIGQSSTLSWVTSNASALSIDNGIGSVVGKTSVVVSPTQTTTYILTAANAAGMSVTQAVIVVDEIVPPPPPTGSDPLDVLANWGTADTNVLQWVIQVVGMLKDMDTNGGGLQQDIVKKWGFSFVNWGVPGAKIRTKDGTHFIG